MVVRKVGRLVKRVAKAPLKVANTIRKNPKKAIGAAYLATAGAQAYAIRRVRQHLTGERRIK